jgi:serine phosphatase RsbU (regulator of sigma subunit)
MAGRGRRAHRPARRARIRGGDVPAEPGDTIVLYSDGITDHMSPSGTEFGRGRLAQVVRSHCHASADGLILEIFRELDKFSTVAFDDQSVFVMKVK